MSVILYQFELCPFCNKVKAGLDLRGISYEIIEVNPMNKKEIEHVEPDENGRKKVPIVEFEGTLLRESTEILKWADGLSGNSVRMTRDTQVLQERIDQIDQWVDDYFMKVLPAVLYGTWGQAMKAARLTADASNFSRWDNLKVSLFGSVIMKMIAKRTLKKLDADGTADELYAKGLTHLESLLESRCIVGDEPSLADAAVHGALSCIRHFPAFETAMSRPLIGEWFERVKVLREEGRRFSSAQQSDLSEVYDDMTSASSAVTSTEI